jgi:hypothetical protein
MQTARAASSIDEQDVVRRQGPVLVRDKSFAFRRRVVLQRCPRVETSSGWGVSTGGLPQQVSCNGIKAFSAKIEWLKPSLSSKPEKVAG